jgi:hypothetical protein
MGKVIYMGSVQGPEKVNDTYMRTMDRGFTVCVSIYIYIYLFVYLFIQFIQI